MNDQEPKRRPASKAAKFIHTPRPSKMAKSLGQEDPRVVEYGDPALELRRLVGLHKRWVNTAKSWEQSVSDREVKETKKIIPCLLPQALRDDIENAYSTLNKEASALETDMRRQLRLMPIYVHFLSKVFPMGVTTPAYLASMVRFERCIKPSHLIRYCGNACGNAQSKFPGKRENREHGPKWQPDGTYKPNEGGTFNAELRMRIYQGMTAMRRNAAKKGPDFPYGTTNKYLTRWLDARHTVITIEKKPGGFAESKGRRKATDLFLEDLYIVGRTLAGLPVWPDFYSVKRGVYHGGARPCFDEGVTLTLEQALEIVGDLGKRPALAPVESTIEDEAAE
jgi:hypothetical protein